MRSASGVNRPGPDVSGVVSRPRRRQETLDRSHQIPNPSPTRSARLAAASDDGAAKATSNVAVSERIAQKLRRRIRSGELKPGVWLRELRLVEEFGAGRNTVREALRVLAEDGLVECVRFRGAQVTAPSPQQMFDLMELRAALFGLVARFTCFRASRETLEQIAATIDELVQGARARAEPDVLVAKSLAIGSMMALHASPDVRQLIESSDRKTRWHSAHLGLAESVTRPGEASPWLALRRALLARDPAAAGDAARNILHLIQEVQSTTLLATGGRPTED